MATKPDFVYLDYQASTPVDEAVLRVYVDTSSNFPANPHAAEHIFGWTAGKSCKRHRRLLQNTWIASR